MILTGCAFWLSSLTKLVLFSVRCEKLPYYTFFTKRERNETPDKNFVWLRNWPLSFEWKHPLTIPAKKKPGANPILKNFLFFCRPITLQWSVKKAPSFLLCTKSHRNEIPDKKFFWTAKVNARFIFEIIRSKKSLYLIRQEFEICTVSFQKIFRDSYGLPISQISLGLLLDKNFSTLHAKKTAGWTPSFEKFFCNALYVFHF